LILGLGAGAGFTSADLSLVGAGAIFYRVTTEKPVLGNAAGLTIFLVSEISHDEL